MIPFSAMAALKGEGYDPQDPSNTGLYVAAALASVALGAGFILLGLKGTSTPPPAGKCSPPCTAPQVCNPVTNSCVTPSNACIPPCSSPAICAAGKCVVPQDGNCVPPCGSGQVCQNGLCLPGILPSCGTLDCPPPNACVNNVCTLLCDPPCLVADQFCNTATCVTKMDGCGNCQTGTPNWSITSITIDFVQDVLPVAAGGPIDAEISFVYVGPGGTASVGFTADISDPSGLIQDLCSYSFTNQFGFYLDGTDRPTPMTVTTQNLHWPSGCLLCGNQPIFDSAVSINAYVIVNDAAYYGPIETGIFSC